MNNSAMKLALAALSVAACSGGSGVKYFVVGGGQFTVPQGTNCGGLSNGACTIATGGFSSCTETSTEDLEAQ
ncbi:MAG TPA: hypothetical protein VMB50_10375, partial [Myxococcales bacterium]|nr:hypothetical protein [Myxococcales bacterium]